tara:strand:+ start:1051 stop:1374 length:324 start_codon:yes stop_codon:yes gene_type:complete
MAGGKVEGYVAASLEGAGFLFVVQELRHPIGSPLGLHRCPAIDLTYGADDAVHWRTHGGPPRRPRAQSRFEPADEKGVHRVVLFEGVLHLGEVRSYSPSEGAEQRTT